MTHTVWLPYDSVDAAVAAIGSHEGVVIDVFPSPDAPVPGSAADVELIALPNGSGGDTWAALSEVGLPRLRLLQLGSAGYESMLDLVPDAVLLANASGVHDASTSEMGVALALANGRRIDEYARQQTEHRWRPLPGSSIADRRVMIFGYGSIGKAVEARLLPFEPAEVVRVAHTARDGVHATDELRSLLPDVDLVFITAPATPETEGTFDADALALLPDDALVVNIGRGTLVDTDAMVAEAGRLRFALDVVDPEPLPADHPLWDAPGVTIAPHVGGHSSAFQPRYDALLREQVRRLGAGESFVNVVAGDEA